MYVIHRVAVNLKTLVHYKPIVLRTIRFKHLEVLLQSSLQFAKKAYPTVRYFFRIVPNIEDVRPSVVASKFKFHLIQRLSEIVPLSCP